MMTHHQELNRNGVTVRKAELRHKPMISIKFPFFLLIMYHGWMDETKNIKRLKERKSNDYTFIHHKLWLTDVISCMVL